jgi:hypothetical protein
MAETKNALTTLCISEQKKIDELAKGMGNKRRSILARRLGTRIWWRQS